MRGINWRTYIDISEWFIDIYYLTVFVISCNNLERAIWAFFRWQLNPRHCNHLVLITLNFHFITDPLVIHSVSRSVNSLRKFNFNDPLWNISSRPKPKRNINAGGLGIWRGKFNCWSCPILRPPNNSPWVQKSISSFCVHGQRLSY